MMPNLPKAVNRNPSNTKKVKNALFLIGRFPLCV